MFRQDLHKRVLETEGGREAIYRVLDTGEIASVTLKDGKKVYIAPSEKMDQFEFKGIRRVERRTIFGILF